MTLPDAERETAIQIELTLTAGTPSQAEYHLLNAMLAGSTRDARGA